MKLDFSQFHDTMHPPFTRHCRSLYPGGWRAGLHHLRLAWAYHRRDQVRGPLHTYLLCRLGRHEIAVWYTNPAHGPVTVRPVCKFCPFERPPTPDEIGGPPRSRIPKVPDNT